MLQFNFKKAHNVGSVNTAVEFVARLELNSRRRSVSKSRMYKQRPLRSQHPLRCCRRRTILLHTDGWWKWDWRTNPRKERETSVKGNRMCCTWGTILSEAKYQSFNKDWRKHYVVLHKQNQGKCTDKNRTRCRSSLQEYKTENTRPATWRSAIENRQTI